jgi:hypothetical protein
MLQSLLKLARILLKVKLEVAKKEIREMGERNNKFWEELIAYFSLIRHGPHRKRRVQKLFFFCLSICCRGNVFT